MLPWADRVSRPRDGETQNPHPCPLRGRGLNQKVAAISLFQGLDYYYS